MVLETYRLAGDEHDFWRKAAHPRTFAEQHAESFEEFLKRVMLYQAPLATPKDLAWFLASYAREAKFRIEAGELPTLAGIRTALEEALGLKFEGARGDHFFRSTLIQTLFYGIFSAWVLWSKSHPPIDKQSRFEWRTAAHFLRLPILRKLFHEVAEPGQLATMNLPEVLDWAGGALNRVDRASFFATFEEGHAVQYFYEPFLEAFDPELRKDLGVWYTPVEIVKYMVARVDQVLREDLKKPDGLADPDVYVLDPCCGTGAYLVEVIQRIHDALRRKGADALVGHDLKRAAMERVFGFEILPAPFVVAHLQLGLLLQRLGSPFSEKGNERAAVYLTNALTGWEPVKHPKQLVFREMEEEREAADRVKRDTPILVVLGNPPYNAFHGVAVGEERGLSEAYRSTRRAPAPQGQGLNDLYVRFFRMAERRIVEKTGRGVVCFISNYSWLDGLSFTGMRERYMEVFDRVWIDNLHGDRIISEYAPDGRTSETVFATGGQSPGIKIGTAIALLARMAGGGVAKIQYRDWQEARAAERRSALLASAATATPPYVEVAPELKLGLPFKPRSVAKGYLSWPTVPELFPVSFPGVKTSRDDVLVDIDREKLATRMEAYFNPAVSHLEMARIAPRAMKDAARFQARQTREYLLKRGFKPEYVVRCSYRPFDVRWLYWEPQTKLLDEKRAEYFPHVFDGNLWMSAAQRSRRDFDPPYVSPHICSLHVIEWSANFFPIWLKRGGLLENLEKVPNLASQAATYAACHSVAPTDVFFHAIAILHAPAYATENAGALRQDWPRVPLPESREALLASAALGQEVAALLDPDSAVKGLSERLPSIAVISSVAGPLDPGAGDLDLTAGWGHAGKGGVTMPAKGRVYHRAYTPEELEALPEGGICALGDTTCDVWLNERAYWKNVPIRAWEYTLGGYQVIKKWLSYREKELLERSLTVEEARYVTGVARRIAAILLLGPALDADYRAVKRALYPWASHRKVAP